MKKPVIILLGTAVVVAAAVGAFVFMNVKDEPVEVVQQTNTSPEPAQGTETPANPTSPVLIGNFVNGDAVHSGTGAVRMTNTADGPILVFSEDFKVTNGPDLFVYLSPNAPGESLGEFASLGKLKSTTGAQSYNAPQNFKDYKSVVIWCRAFRTTFSAAELKQQ